MAGTMYRATTGAKTRGDEDAGLKPRRYIKFSEGVWPIYSSCPLAHARTSLQSQVHDKSGSVDPSVGRDSTHLYIYMWDVRLPNMTRCPYLYAYAASRW